MRKILTALMIVSMIGVDAFANQDGTSTATFLRIGQGSRAEGMGGAFTAIADDAHAVYWNPAGLAQITRKQVALNHLQFIEEIDSQYAAMVLPVNNLNGSLGFGLTYLDMGEIDRRDINNASTSGETKVTAYSGTLSWGQALGDRLALGAGAKFFNQNLAGETGSGYAMDLGALFFVQPDKLALGLSISNIGPKIKTGTTDESIPLTYAGGLAYYAIPRKLTFSADLSKERDSEARLHGGAEYTFQGRFILRAGYQDTKEAEGGLSAGFGYLWRPRADSGSDFFGRQDNTKTLDQGLDIRFDYAYVDYGDFDATHRVGIHLSF